MASPITSSSRTEFNRPIDDVLRARLKTLGVSEHRFTLDTGNQSCYVAYRVRLMSFCSGNLMSHDWRVFDVGGARSLVGHGYFVS
jgi:guanine nucleotide-binding protein subunit alpha